MIKDLSICLYSIDKANLLIQVTFHSVLSPIMLASPDNFYGQLHIASLNGLNSFLMEYSDDLLAWYPLSIFLSGGAPYNFFQIIQNKV